MEEDIPQGLTFTQAYLRPSDPLKDSMKFRVRLLAIFAALAISNSWKIAEALQMSAGIEVPQGFESHNWNAFFKRAPIEDILTAIGVIHGSLRGTAQGDRWGKFVRIIFEEEAMGYRLNECGQVRKLVDDEFQRSRFAAVAGLGQAKYHGALKHLEAATACLEASPMDTRGMVREVLESVEEVFKHLTGETRLSGSNAAKFQPHATAIHQTAITAAKELQSSFGKWASAAQQYRHAAGIEMQPGEDPARPPEDLAIAMFGSGCAFLRWLISSAH